MHDLIKIENTTIGSETVPTVNARELHEFLGSQRQFSDWIKKRIEDYDFLENKDYLIFHKKMKNSSRGRPTIEYHISIDMAKELAMVENNEKGREARRYFIECEKQLQTRTLPQTYLQTSETLPRSSRSSKTTLSITYLSIITSTMTARIS